MDFEFTEEQRLLKETVDRFTAAEYDFEQRNQYAKERGGWSPAVWRRFAELGLLGLPFSESHGGFGRGPVELMIVMEAFGRALVLEPYFSTIVLGGSALRRALSPDLQAALIPQVVAGEMILGFAWMERQSRYNHADVKTTAKKDGAGWRLSGEKTLVLHGDSADKLIVTARVSGAQRDRKGIGVFLVDAKAEGVERRGYPTQDGLRAAEIAFNNVRLEDIDLIAAPEQGDAFVERMIDEAMAALCAEAVGVMSVMQETTVEYLKTRQQFGRPIGQFQALQHRAVDMLIALEQARSMAMFATMMVEEENATERRRAMCAAKAQIGRSGRKIGEEAIQLHGGIGMTMEYKVGHYFKRMTMLDRQFGDAEFHIAALADMGGLISA
jgi:pimeloyl-CoA dehydrogenase small subunit